MFAIVYGFTLRLVSEAGFLKTRLRGLVFSATFNVGHSLNIDYSSVQDKKSSFIPNLLIFDRTGLLSSLSGRNHPVYSKVRVGTP